MTDPKLHELLDQTKFGDQLTLAHSNGKHTTHVSGPVLTDQSQEPSVGIDLLDGDPHIVRTPTGIVWAPVVQAVLRRGDRLIAKWEEIAGHPEAPQTSPPSERTATTAPLADARAAFAAAAATGWSEDALTEVISQIINHLEAQDTPQQPTTAPPAAQQGDSGHRDGGEAVQAAMAVLGDMGADSGGWHSWRCFDRLYPEPCDCTKQATRAAIAAAEPHIRAKTLAPIRAALADHPRCDIHPDDDPIKCGWKRAVADIQAALDREEQP